MTFGFHPIPLQVQLAPNQMAAMQNMMAAKGQQMGMSPQMIFQQRPGGGGDMPILQQQLTRQNLVRDFDQILFIFIPISSYFLPVSSPSSNQA